MRVATIGDDGQIYEAGSGNGHIADRPSKPPVMPASVVSRAPAVANPLLHELMSAKRPAQRPMPPPFISNLGQAPKPQVLPQGRPFQDSDFLNRVFIRSGRRARPRGLGQEPPKVLAVQARGPYEIARSFAVSASGLSWSPVEGDPKSQIFPGRFVLSDRFPGQLLRIGFRPSFASVPSVNLLILSGSNAGKYISNIPVQDLQTFLVVPEDRRFEVELSFVTPTPNLDSPNSDFQATVMWSTAMFEFASNAMTGIDLPATPAEFGRKAKDIQIQAYTAVVLAIQALESAGSAFDFNRMGRRAFRILVKLGHEIFSHAWKLFALAVDVGNNPTQEGLNAFGRIRQDAIASNPYWAGLAARAFLITSQYMLGKVILNEMGYASGLNLVSSIIDTLTSKRDVVIRDLVGKTAPDGTTIGADTAARIVDEGVKFYRARLAESEKLDDDYTRDFRSKIFTNEFGPGDIEVAYATYEGFLRTNARNVKQALDQLRKDRKTTVILFPEEGLSGLGQPVVDVGKKPKLVDLTYQKLLSASEEILKDPKKVEEFIDVLKKDRGIIDINSQLVANLSARYQNIYHRTPENISTKNMRRASFQDQYNAAEAALTADPTNQGAAAARRQAKLDMDALDRSITQEDYIREGALIQQNRFNEAVLKLQKPDIRDRIEGMKDIARGIVFGTTQPITDAAGREAQVKRMSAALGSLHSLPAEARPFEVLYDTYQSLRKIRGPKNEEVFSTDLAVNLTAEAAADLGVTPTAFSEYLRDTIAPRVAREAQNLTGERKQKRLEESTDILDNLVGKFRSPPILKDISDVVQESINEITARLTEGRLRGVKVQTTSKDAETAKNVNAEYVDRLAQAESLIKEIEDRGVDPRDPKKPAVPSLLFILNRDVPEVQEIVKGFREKLAKFRGAVKSFEEYLTADKVAKIRSGEIELSEVHAKIEAIREAWNEVEPAYNKVFDVKMNKVVSLTTAQIETWLKSFHAFFTRHLTGWMELGGKRWTVGAVLGLFLLPAILTPLLFPIYLIFGIPLELLPLNLVARIVKSLSKFLPDAGVDEEGVPGGFAGPGSGLRLFILLMGVSIIFFGKQFFPAVQTFFQAIRGSVTQVTSIFKKKGKGAKRPVGRPRKEEGERRGPGRPPKIEDIMGVPQFKHLFSRR